MKDQNRISKVFVTGADGMLGSNICRELLHQGYSVKAMILPNRKPMVLEGLCMQIVKGDILDKPFLEREMRECDGVIHAAALTTLWPKRLEAIKSVNLDGTKNVMEVASSYGIMRMVYIGSASSFKFGSKEKPADETSAFDGWKYGMDYIDSKYQAQKLLLSKHAMDRFPVVILNPTYMIGPYDSSPSSGKLLIALFNGKLPCYSSGGKNFVCAIDVAKATVNALKLGRIGECYIVGNENLEYGEFFRKACALWGKRFKLLKVPEFLILCFGLFNSIIARAMGKQPVVSFSMARLAKQGQYYSSKKAQQELEFSPVPIEKGIEQCVSWFETNGYLK